MAKLTTQTSWPQQSGLLAEPSEIDLDLLPWWRIVAALRDARPLTVGIRKRGSA